MIPVTGRGARTVLAGLVALPLALAACSSSKPTPLASQATSSTAAVRIVAAENEYGNVASQIGGHYVDVTSIESNPNTDPHTYEVSPGVARAVSAAQVVIQNGVGYDTFMSDIESASPNSKRQVIDVQKLLDLPDSTSNPHLWYSPATMPKVADALAVDLSKLLPADASYFNDNASQFVRSLSPWLADIEKFKTAYPNTPVATTEPVADYMLQAAGTLNVTPFEFQADIMNGVDPTPQDISLEASQIGQHKVKVFVYNQQVTDSLTQSFITDAHKADVPIVGVYETMPTPGYDYQTWMVAETTDLTNAVAHGTSTERL